MSYWDTFEFSIAVSIHYSVSAGVLITNSHTHAKLLTSVLSILLSFSICGSGPQKGTLPNPQKIQISNLTASSITRDLPAAPNQ